MVAWNQQVLLWGWIGVFSFSSFLYAGEPEFEAMWREQLVRYQKLSALWSRQICPHPTVAGHLWVGPKILEKMVQTKLGRRWKLKILSGKNTFRLSHPQRPNHFFTFYIQPLPRAIRLHFSPPLSVPSQQKKYTSLTLSPPFRGFWIRKGKKLQWIKLEVSFCKVQSLYLVYHIGSANLTSSKELPPLKRGSDEMEWLEVLAENEDLLENLQKSLEKEKQLLRSPHSSSSPSLWLIFTATGLNEILGKVTPLGEVWKNSSSAGEFQLQKFEVSHISPQRFHFRFQGWLKLQKLHIDDSWPIAPFVEKLFRRQISFAITLHVRPRWTGRRLHLHFTSKVHSLQLHPNPHWGGVLSSITLSQALEETLDRLSPHSFSKPQIVLPLFRKRGMYFRLQKSYLTYGRIWLGWSLPKKLH